MHCCQTRHLHWTWCTPLVHIQNPWRPSQICPVPLCQYSVRRSPEIQGVTSTRLKPPPQSCLGTTQQLRWVRTSRWPIKALRYEWKPIIEKYVLLLCVDINGGIVPTTNLFVCSDVHGLAYDMLCISGMVRPWLYLILYCLQIFAPPADINDGGTQYVGMHGNQSTLTPPSSAHFSKFETQSLTSSSNNKNNLANDPDSISSYLKADDDMMDDGNSQAGLNNIGRSSPNPNMLRQSPNHTNQHNM